MEKFESGGIQEVEAKPEDASGLTPLAKKVLNESRQISLERISASNSEISQSFTNFIDIALHRIQNLLSEEELKEFNQALVKYPVVDLACGMPVGGNRTLFRILFESMRGASSYYNSGIVDPVMYIGVDKYHDNEVPEELKGRVRFEKKDIIEFLRGLPNDSANIFIGGFDRDISRPNEEEDRYRAVMLAEIARVMGVGGYGIAASSPLFGSWNGQKVNPKSLGLKEVSSHFMGQSIHVIKKEVDEEMSSPSRQ